MSGEDTQNLHEPQLSHLLCEDPDDLLAGFSVHSTSLSPPTLAPLPSSVLAALFPVCICMYVYMHVCIHVHIHACIGLVPASI